MEKTGKSTDDEDAKRKSIQKQVRWVSSRKAAREKEVENISQRFWKKTD